MDWCYRCERGSEGPKEWTSVVDGTYTSTEIFVRVERTFQARMMKIAVLIGKDRNRGVII